MTDHNVLPIIGRGMAQAVSFRFLTRSHPDPLIWDLS